MQDPSATVAGSPVPSRSARIALRIVQAGALAVVLAATTNRQFDLDRFLVPKELILHLSAFLAGLIVLRKVGRAMLASRTDALLAAFVLWSAVSALFAKNPWLAIRAVALTVSSVLLFHAGRSIASAGWSRPLLNAIALAVVLAAITSLLQAYGVRLDLFSLNRSPGGTLGNRNFVGHAAAFGLPVVFLAALRARKASGFVSAAAGVMIVAAALVLTRSRAAWLAAAAVVLIVFAAPLFARGLRRQGRVWARLLAIAGFAAAAVVGALSIPNTLRWNSDNPYLESVRGVAAYEEGSGRGRLVQYERSLRMTLAHPLFGVGPGNWPVVYPAFAPRSDPSMDHDEGGVTSNPWPSSDWIAFVSERGPLAAVLILLAFLQMALAAFRRMREAEDAEGALTGMAMLATLAAVCAAGAFDAVLLLALPAFLVWTALGALSGIAVAPEPIAIDAGADPQPPPPPRGRHRFSGTLLATLFVLVSLAGALRSAAQIAGMSIYTNRGDRVSLEQAARIDPGSYRLRLRLARVAKRSERCSHARAAHALFPQADAAAAAARSCGEKN